MSAIAALKTRLSQVEKGNVASPIDGAATASDVCGTAPDPHESEARLHLAGIVQLPTARLAAGAAVMRRHGARLAPLAALLVVGFIAKALFQTAAEVRAEDVMAALSATSPTALALAVGFTALSFLCLVFYDVSALDHIGARLPLGAVARTSFCAYAVGNTAGFGALSGGAVRYRAYSRLGLEPEAVAKVVAFVALAFALGLAAVTALALLVTPDGVATGLGLDPAASRIGAGVVVVLLGAAFLVSDGQRPLRLGRFSFAIPGRAMVLRQLVVTGADVAAASLVLYCLMPEIGMDWPAFLGVFAVATGLGVLSNIPAGLGVFEAVIMAATAGHADLETVLGALVVYRLVYHMAPLAIAVVLLVSAEVERFVGRAAELQLLGAKGAVSAGACAAATFGLGLAMLLPLFSASPGLTLFQGVMPQMLQAGAPLATTLCGLLLAIAARGLAQRLDGALQLSLVAATFGLLAAFIGSSIVEAGLALVVLGLLWPRRALFSQSSVLTSGGAGATSMLSAATAILGFGLAVAATISSDGLDPWRDVLLSTDAGGARQALLLFGGLAGTLGLSILLRPVAPALEAPLPDALQQALAIVEAQGLGDANLVRMGDKSVLFSADGSAFIMYAKRGRSFIALFDPIGPKEAWSGLVWRFIDAAKAAGCRAVFYQISPALLSHCADAGLRAFKLGEQAMVDLERFDLKGGKWLSLRRSINRAERDGLQFSVVAKDGVAAIIDELEAVSDTWLAHHNVREKGFSLGTFDRAYLAAQPVAVMRMEGRIVAFASLLATNRKEDAFIDLMRFLPGIHRGMMDLLFVRIMDHLKAEGFRNLNLGMAPLARMSDRSNAPLWNQIGRAVFEFGESLYNFKGLLAFKSKFDPDWQPRYLAVSGGNNPYLALMDVAILIGGGIRGVFRK